MKFKFLASLIVQVIAFGTKCKSDSSLLFMANFQSKQDTLQPNTRVAFLGDQGLGINPKAVLNMIKTWNAQAMVHLGDFDYFDDPLTFSKMHDEIFDPSFPIFGVVGNHDIVKWQEYRNFFTTRLSRSGALGNCRGDFGVNSICKWNGLNFILSGVDHSAQMDSLLESTKDMESTLPKWNFACWHKNQRDYQTGDKFDETGYEIYETARRHGAMILTAHQHLYARSKLMDNFEHHQISPENMKNDQDIESFKRKKKKHRKKNPKQPPSSNTLYLKSGSSFVVVSGLGGHSIRSWQDGLENNPWWAANAALNNGVNYGALLCTFYIDNNPRLAHCEFKDIDGTIWDSFYIRSPLQNEPVSRHSDIQVGDYNQQVFTTRHRQSRFTETTIRDVFDIKTIASNGSVSYSSRLLFPCSNESKTRHILKFKNLSTHNKSIHLQLMLSRSLSKWSNNKMEIVITSYTGDYIIDHINDSDVGEVYVSKDIKDILNIIDGNVEIIVHGTTLPLNGECIGRSVEGVSSESFCLSPTLAVIE